MKELLSSPLPRHPSRQPSPTLQQAKSFELRAVMSLSRLLLRQGKTEDARRMLAESHGWFIEGFDTEDLKETAAMLRELL